LVNTKLTRGITLKVEYIMMFGSMVIRIMELFKVKFTKNTLKYFPYLGLKLRLRIWLSVNVGLRRLNRLWSNLLIKININRIYLLRNLIALLDWWS